MNYDAGLGKKYGATCPHELLNTGWLASLLVSKEFTSLLDLLLLRDRAKLSLKEHQGALIPILAYIVYWTLFLAMGSSSE